MLKLVKPEQDVFTRWFEESTQRQAEDRAWAEGGSVEAHRAQLDAMIPRLLPQGLETPGHVFRIAETEDGEDVAFVWLGAAPGMPENMMLLFDVCVSPEHRRKGFAREILTKTFGHLRSEGVAAVALHARGDNVPALSLYERLGFARTEASADGKKVQMLLQLTDS